MFKKKYKKIIMKNSKIFVTVVIATFIGFVSAMSLSQIKIKKLEIDDDITLLDDKNDKNNIYYKNGKFLSEILYRIKNDYVDEKTDKDLHQAAAKGLLSSLDPHSGYLNYEDLKEMQTQTKGEFGGLGIEITTEMQAVKIIAAIDDTPAQRAGLKSGDFIIKVDGENIVGLSISESVKKLRGKPGSKVKVTLLRKDEKQPLIKEITIIKIATPSIIPKKEKIEIIFKKPSFFLGLRFLDEISLSTFVNKILSFKFRFNIF